MGQVIPIADATRVSSTDAVLTFIDECYDRLVKAGGFVARPEQRQLSREVCRALCAGEPLAAEAPTGTGKTLAYLIGAIAAAEKLRGTKDIPIVVATATVGLQGQILQGDLPRLYAAGILAEGDGVLAKGRSRYFCVQSAERLLEAAREDAQYDIFDEEANLDVNATEEVREMLEAYHGRAWNGDSDSYTGMPPSAWDRVRATSETCTGHKCEHYSSCPFFNARRALSSARVIVANHDLVLADLAMVRDGIDPLFPGGKYLVVFDEAHHLPDKALDAGSAALELEPMLGELPRIGSFNKSWQRQVELVRLFTKAKVEEADLEPAALSNALSALRAEVLALDFEPETRQHRFVLGELPEPLRRAAELALEHALAMHEAFQDATGALKQTNLPEKNEALKPVIAELLYQAAFFNSKLSALVKGLTLLTNGRRAVRWAFRGDPVSSLHVSPLEGADVLRELLWGSERVSVAMVSATLRDFEGFERFAARVGAPESLRTLALPHIFPYRENTLYLVDMTYSPRYEEKDKFVTELIQSLPRFLDPNEGTLVLFPSRAMMRVVLPVLRQAFGSKVLAQGDMGIKELIAEHKRRVLSGQGNILCGLAVLAEGLDLPGELCTHVVICALPFSVPTTPVERELQELLGKDYFAKRALPDTLVKLIQMVGRLMRRESDRGRITLYDKRLLYTQWGRKMLNALPEFRRKLVRPDAPPLRAV